MSLFVILGMLPGFAGDFEAIFAIRTAHVVIIRQKILEQPLSSLDPLHINSQLICSRKSYFLNCWSDQKTSLEKNVENHHK